jgi:hypothetical protein
MEWFPDFNTAYNTDPLFSSSKRLGEDHLNATERKDVHKKK